MRSEGVLGDALREAHHLHEVSYFNLWREREHRVLKVTGVPWLCALNGKGDH